MSKVVVFKGSPRTHGYTSKLLDQVAQGAKSKGAEIMEFDLNDAGIRGCQGCFHCRTHDDCAVKDYLEPMYRAIREADAVVFGSPIYCSQITGQAKVWLDRTFPMLGNDFAPRHPGKKLITVFAQGNSDPQKGADCMKFVHNTLEWYGWKLETSIHFCGTTNPDMAIFDRALANAFDAGQMLI